MKYAHFESLALVLGGVAIVASVFVSPVSTPQTAEVVAQLLLIVVLAGALHWGRNGGFAAAIFAIAVYVVMRIPLLESQGFSQPLVTMLVIRTVTYALVGVVGGELAARVKYLFARIENESLVDAESGLYSARFAAEAIRSGIGQWERYQTDFSVVSIVLSPEVLSTTRRPSQTRQLLRQIAAYLRNNVRMVDDLAFTGPRTFLVLLPKTPAEGGAVVLERLGTGVREMLASEDGVQAQLFTAGVDSAALRELTGKLVPEGDGEPDGARAAERRQLPVA